MRAWCVTVLGVAVVAVAATSARAESSPARAAPVATSPRALAEDFMRLVDAGQADAAIDWMNAHNSAFADRDRRNPEWAAKHRQNFQRYLAAEASLMGHATLAERVVGDRLLQLNFAVWGQATPLFIGLTLYRRGDGAWGIISWSFGANAAQLLDPAWSTTRDKAAP